MIAVTSFKWVPPFAKGLVRDLRVRWALEEAGLPYENRLIGPEDQASAAYRAKQPFGQVPVYEEDGLVLFESGAIVLHIAARSPALMPADAAGRARAQAWVLAALNSVEIVVQQLAGMDLFHAGEDWARQQRPAMESRVKKRLAEVSAWLGEAEYLDGAFSAGDLMMASVLRILRHTDLVEADARLHGYLRRCEARPAFQRALAAQMGSFEVR